MTTAEALTTLINAVRIASRRGAFELSEAKVIEEAVQIFTKGVSKATSAGNNPTDGQTESNPQTEAPKRKPNKGGKGA